MEKEFESGINYCLMRIGLTLGKFAPLHKGHELLIKTAINEMDHVIVVIYDDPITNISLCIRANWIRQLFPQIEVIEGKNAPTVTGYTSEIKRIQENYILKLLNGITISHFYSSEPYGEHMSRALGAVNRVVDQNRTRIPISATKIRKDFFLNKQYVSNVVYKDLITNIVLLGAPSTGKTTLAEHLASFYNTQWMPEYGREYWDKYQVDRRLSLDQLVEIAEGHIERENELLLQSNKFLFSDTNAITTLIFSYYYHQKALKKLVDLARQAEKRYDLVFVCDTDIPYENTWDRSGIVNRKRFQKKTIEELHRREIPYYTLSGTIEERTKEAHRILSNYCKY